MALAQSRVADFMVLILGRICLILSYAMLDVLIVAHNLSNSQGSSHIDYGLGVSMGGFRRPGEGRIHVGLPSVWS